MYSFFYLKIVRISEKKTIVYFLKTELYLRNCSYIVSHVQKPTIIEVTCAKHPLGISLGC